jgi:hypothetical protein
MRRLVTIALAALASVPPAVIVLCVARHARNVPYWDQWGLVPFMADVAHGRLPIEYLRIQVNEHRIPLTLVVQGVVSWATRWDVRFESWMNVVAALATLVALGALARRTVGAVDGRTRDALGAPAVWGLVVVCSAFVFSPAGGSNWTWGSLNATYFAALAAATLAWQVAAWRPTIAATARLGAFAAAGALAFGTGVILLLLVPAALLLHGRSSLHERAPHAVATALWAAAAIGLYCIGWQPRFGHRPPVMHWDRLADYVRYSLGYVGGVARPPTFADALGAGVDLVVLLVAGSAWLVYRHGDAARIALVGWWLLAAYSLGNGALTAFGRLDSGGFATATFDRYLPTASFFAIGTAGVSTLAVRGLWMRKRSLGLAALALVAVTAIDVLRPAPHAVLEGVDRMQRLSAVLDGGARCLAAAPRRTAASA